MPPPEPVEFALQGEINGTPISPAHVPFGVMRKFHEDVEKLVLGSNQGSLHDTVVQIRHGSYALVVPIPPSLRESFERDIEVAHDADAAVHRHPLWHRPGLVQRAPDRHQQEERKVKNRAYLSQ